LTSRPRDLIGAGTAAEQCAEKVQSETSGAEARNQKMACCSGEPLRHPKTAPLKKQSFSANREATDHFK